MRDREIQVWDVHASYLCTKHELTATIARLEAKVAMLMEAGSKVIEWYDRDGSVGGACDPMEDLRAAIAPDGDAG